MSGAQRASMEGVVNQCMDVGFSNNTVNLIDSDCTETVNALPTLSNEVASEFEAAWQVLRIALTNNRNFWAPYHRQSLVWAFFKLNEPDIEVDVKAIQVMKCTICHPSNATSSSSSRSATRHRKGVLQYNPLHGLTSMKNHVMNEHLTEFQRYKASLTELEESARQKTKKRKGVQPSAITEFFAGHKSYHKGDVQQKHFLEDLVLFIAKGYETLAVVESLWLRRLVMRRDPKVKFPTRKALVHEHIPALLAKTMERYVLPAIASCATASITFDLWMSRAGFDTFALVVNFIDDCWEPRHVTVGLFEAHDTSGVAIAEIVKPLLDEFQLTKKIIAWVKDEGSNLTTLERALQLTVSCDVLDIKQPYAGACFGHVMSKACQYATDDDKVCREMTELSLRSAQTALQSCITWTKKSGKGGAEWRKACIKAGLPARKLRTPVKTRFASKVILFQETLEYADAINICYAAQSLKLQARVPTGVTWAVARTVTETLNPVVKQCVLNQTRGYWLLSDALAAALAISVELRAHVDHVSSMNPPLQHGDFDAELEILRAKMSLEAMLVMKPFLSFTQFFTSEKAHNMIVLMVDPRFKGLECVIAYTGVEKARAIVREYDQKVLIPYLVKVRCPNSFVILIL